MERIRGFVAIFILVVVCTEVKIGHFLGATSGNTDDFVKLKGSKAAKFSDMGCRKCPELKFQMVIPWRMDNRHYLLQHIPFGNTDIIKEMD